MDCDTSFLNMQTYPLVTGNAGHQQTSAPGSRTYSSSWVRFEEKQTQRCPLSRQQDPKPNAEEIEQTLQALSPKFRNSGEGWVRKQREVKSYTSVSFFYKELWGLGDKCSPKHQPFDCLTNTFSFFRYIY